ncbi:MAG: lipopolysaccharide biosynthesis protein [Candidatus Lokiarchaeota archaeon]|nr:lipopolysaccharide biosynthesis protein [Candidatus Lokiarchaeota archaeon]
MKRITPRKLTILSVAMIISMLVLFSNGNLFANAQSLNKTDVLYIGGTQGNYMGDVVGIDKENIAVTMGSASDLTSAGLTGIDVVVLNDVNLTTDQITNLTTWAAVAGHGVFIILGNDTLQNNYLTAFGFTDKTSFSDNTDHTVVDPLNPYHGLSNTEGSLDNTPFRDIVWNTAPEIYNFSQVSLLAGATSFVNMSWSDDPSIVTNETLIAGVQYGASSNTNVYLFTGWFQDDFKSTSANEHFMLWPYFNYMVFNTIQMSTGLDHTEYEDWKYSPVPHLISQIVLGGVVAIAAIVAITFFVRARKRKSEASNLLVSEDLSNVKVLEVEESTHQEVIVERRITEAEVHISKENRWEVVGFHRQISGFFKLFFVMILLLIPQLLVTSIVMPNWIQPYPQASGWYSYTLRFFEAIWLVFDLGFNYAITKKFAEHRIENPRKAYHYVQLFVWWEILSGVVQLLMFTFIGAIIFPQTDFSYLSWMFIVHSLIQFPGIFLVFQYFFSGLQRSDLEMIAFALQYFVLRLVLQVATVPLFKWIFGNFIMYGEAFGAGVGLLIGQLLGDVVLFGITMKMYKKLGLPIGPVFAAEFSKEEFKETAWFGFKMVIGNMWVPLVWMLQVFWVGRLLPNSSAEQGYFELAFTISTVPQAISLLMNAMIGGLTEAHTYKKKNLLNYVSYSGTRWGSIWTFFLASTFLAIGQPFILGASGPNWARAAALMPWLMVYRMLGPISWQMDFEFAAADKPALAGLAWIVEQSIRGVLTWTLLFYMRTMEAVIIAYIISLGTKDILVIILVRLKIHKWDWNLWTAFIAPILAAGVNFAILYFGVVYLFVDILFGIGILSAMLLFVVGMFMMEFVYSFFLGLLGGFDDNTLKELDMATDMVTGVRFFARTYYWMAYAGCKISPLHNQFPVKVYEAAQKEAEELTQIKKKIVL